MVKIKISNYRSIPVQSPVEFELKDGITMFLGPNNVGKSNILRFFYDFRNPFLIHSHKFQKSIGASERSYLHELSFSDIVNRQNKDQQIVAGFTIDEFTFAYSLSSFDPPETNHALREFSVAPFPVNTKAEKKFFTLLSSLKNSIHIGSNRNFIHQSDKNDRDIAIGLNFYDQFSQWASGGDTDKRERILDLEEELKELFQFRRFNLRTSPEKNSLMVTTDDGVFPLQNLGGGIAHYIISLANALIKEPDYIFIDEPETGLHPKLQKLFVHALAAKAKKGLLATTHSVALARSTADSIYSLSRDKTEPFKTFINPYGQYYEPHLDETISEMSYSQYAELGGTNILLVEGRTDVKFFQEILRKYQLEQHFIIIPIGGKSFMSKEKKSVITELQEIQRFNTEVAVIVDSDKTSFDSPLDKSLSVFAECCKDLGYQIHLTEGNSTENYIRQHVLDKEFGKRNQKELDQFEKFKQTSQWKKEKNWLLAREMTKQDFEGTELEKFILEELKPMVERSSRS